MSGWLTALFRYFCVFAGLAVKVTWVSWPTATQNI